MEIGAELIKTIHARLRGMIKQIDREITNESFNIQSTRAKMQVVKKITDMRLVELRADDLQFILDMLDGKKTYSRRTTFVSYTWDDHLVEKIK